MPHTVVPALKTLVLSLSSPEIPHPGMSSLIHSQKPLGDYVQFCFKLLFIEDGKGWHFFSHRKICVMPGDLFLIPPGEAYNMSGLENTKSWVVVFETNTLDLNNTEDLNSTDEDLLLLSLLQPRATDILHFRVAQTERPRLITRLHELKCELCGKSRGFEKSVRALLLLLLIDTARMADSQLRKFSLQSKPLLTKVFQFIETNYCNQVGLLDVAKEVNLSAGYLTDLVRRNTGKTVLSWIVERRMAEARRLLLITKQPVYEIAEAVGYLDTSHFIRQFRQHHGTTPQAWRHTCRS